MLRGTRIIEGYEAQLFGTVLREFETIMDFSNFDKIYVPTITEESVFLDKVGTENSNMMWRFKDKGNRNVCLIPEVTGIIQERWNSDWSKTNKFKAIFYTSRCYRYERPQKGRYREFTQFGIEILGDYSLHDFDTPEEYLKRLLDSVGVEYKINSGVERCQSYYTDDKFEAVVNNLGTQNQIAGGGSYNEGTGFAIGVDRVVQSIMEE